MQIENPAKLIQYYQALIDRDQQYLGQFIVGVKTTGIFCIPTCRARKPKFENVSFYSELKDALTAGFRPCKICKPTQNNLTLPDDIAHAMQLFLNNPKEKLKDYQLRLAGVQPEKIRRWFNKNYGMTFQAYQRMYRINSAFQEIKNGKVTTQTAYDHGYDSLSGFGYTYKKIMGKAPTQSKNQNVILLSRVDTPIGPMFCGATDKGICLLEFVDRKMLETEFKELQRLLDAKIIYGENQHIKQTKRELKEYFNAQRKCFEVDLDAPGTAFQQQVWQELMTIPSGSTRSYQEQAIAIGNSKAVRAVARANGMNRIGIIIPCHRVIGKDGSLTGYGGGLERKRWLLDLEAKMAN